MTSEPNIIAIASSKGGTGKSIIAASIGYVLAHCGFKTLLVDMDLFTHGLTFYVLEEYRGRAKGATEDIFRSGREELKLVPVDIPHKFVKGNLALLPSTSRRRRLEAELTLAGKYNDITEFRLRCESMLKAMSEYSYDYILVDTRGGTDHTSVGLAIAAGGFVVVTEADKPSWDMGRMLLDTIEAAATSERGDALGLGFIINKNVLPPEAIEAFLRKEWEMPHLATIPLDECAVRFFQEGKVPVSENIGCPFSSKVLDIVRKLFYSESWADANREQLEELELQAQAIVEANDAVVEESRMAERLSFTLRVYGTIVAIPLVVYLGVMAQKAKESGLPLVFAITSALVIVLMTVSEPHFLRRIIQPITRRVSLRAKGLTNQER